MIPKVSLPRSRVMITLAVRRREWLSPGFASVTLGGPAVRDLVVAGNDQAVRLFFPRAGQADLRMPTLSNEAWMAQLLLMPKSVRPWVRNLTIRRVRPEEDELDIEFAVHADSPLSFWVRRIEPGDPAGIFDIGTMYRRPEDATAQLLVGDETALPAVLSILDSTPPSLPTQVFLEVAATADIRPLDPSDGVTIHWFGRDDAQRPGDLALEAVRRAELPAGQLYTWIAGESRLATSVRRHLVNDRGLPKRDISFFGYWRLGRSSPG
ncbi:siderophore-interacting protein [Actinoplanes sp. TRM 88003]|uniref:Siderophore-interacting protein n=1 Tax=Paractinoplanes aksuensis TaxID=2939490 RepID=A0ABT1DTU6_9ACTN|nr:siderophore-interacting protein [Actinoplanes aksuensis]MCO8274280.1 siderophore-interacting protein [Actinoplanes aksuensis]